MCAVPADTGAARVADDVVSYVTIMSYARHIAKTTIIAEVMNFRRVTSISPKRPSGVWRAETVFGCKLFPRFHLARRTRRDRHCMPCGSSLFPSPLLPRNDSRLAFGWCNERPCQVRNLGTWGFGRSEESRG